MDTSPFFKVGHTYRHPVEHACDERFLVEHVATPPEDFARKGATGPTAFGWIVAIKADGSEVRFGSYNLDDFTGWVLDPDAEIAPRVAYRAEYAGMTLGHYVDQADARQHCEGDLDDNVDTDGQQLAWVPFSPLAPDDVELTLGDEQESTGYSVVPVEQLTAYDPKAEG